MPDSNGTYLHVNTNTAAGGAAVSVNPSAVLKRVVINTVGAAANVLTLYNGQSTSAPIVAVVNTTNAAVPSLDYNAVFSGGIWYTLLTGTAADLTFVYQ